MTENLLDPNTNMTQGYFDKLVGEGRKFKDGDTLAKAKEDSDEYVRTLERQKDEYRAEILKYREQLSEQANLQELYDRLEAKQKLTETTPNAVNQDVQKPQFDPKELEGLVSKSIQAHEMTKTQEQNFNSVKAKLQERFGDKYQAVLKQQVDSLGLTDDYINDMARKAPSALFRLLGVDATAANTFTPPPRSDSRGDSFTPIVQQDRTWKWYQDLKKTDFKTYSDPKTQVQMHNDAVRLGERFKDGDYAAFD